MYQVYEQYVVGMLTNLESLPLDRIHNMLKMFVQSDDGNGGYDRTEQAAPAASRGQTIHGVARPPRLGSARARALAPSPEANLVGSPPPEWGRRAVGRAATASGARAGQAASAAAASHLAAVSSRASNLVPCLHALHTSLPCLHASRSCSASWVAWSRTAS